MKRRTFLQFLGLAPAAIALPAVAARVTEQYGTSPVQVALDALRAQRWTRSIISRVDLPGAPFTVYYQLDMAAYGIAYDWGVMSAAYPTEGQLKTYDSIATVAFERALRKGRV